MFRVDILSARAAWLGSGWGWALECSFEYLYCFHPDCPCSHMASPEPRRAAVGRRHGKGISRRPASRRPAHTPTLEAHGPDRAPRQVASGVLESQRGERRAGQKRAPGISKITNEAPIHLPPASPSRHPHQALPPPLAGLSRRQQKQVRTRKSFWQRTSCCGRSEPLMDGAAWPVPPGAACPPGGSALS